MDNKVYIELPVSTIEETDEQPSLTYKLDLDRGRITGRIDGLEAVKQAIRKAIITPRFKCLIYDHQYGSEIEEAYFSTDVSEDFIRATAQSYIEDCLKPDTRIVRVYNFSFDFSDDAVEIDFYCDTIFGKTEIKEVI